MKTVPLGEATERVRNWNPVQEPEAEFIYVDLSAVDNIQKAITAPAAVIGQDAPSRARQLLKTDDVLVSTVRPNLNAVALVGPDLDGATASTGFTVLRSLEGLDAKYLFHWVRTPQFVSDMVRKATGASYPAVSDRIVKESLIPLPPMDEQRRIAAILDHADGLREKRRIVAQRLDELVTVLYSEAAARTADHKTLAELGIDFTSGKNVLASGPGQEHPDNRIIKVSAISSGRFDPDEIKPMPGDYSPPETHRIRRGDVLFGRASGSLDLLGATTVVDQDCENYFLPDKVWRLEVPKGCPISREFAFGVLRSREFRSYIRHNASGAAGVRNISKSKVLDFLAPVPPLADQRSFGVGAQLVASQVQLSVATSKAADVLFASLQSRAFSGQL